MADVTVIPGNVEPLGGAQVRRGTAGGSGNVGDAVYLNGSSGWQPADADFQASAQARGVAVGVGAEGKTAFAAGDPIDVVTEGPVEGFAGMTPGGAVFVSTTAGKVDQTAPAASGDFVFALGWAESPSVLYVHPQAHVPVANS